MRRNTDFFDDCEMASVFITKRLRDALRLEDALTKSGIGYAVQTETYVGGMIFRSERVGAFFYVAPDAVGLARTVVAGLGRRPQMEVE